MKINEILEFPPGDGEFELLNLTDAIDIDLFKDILKDNDYALTFNGVVLNESYDALMKPFAEELMAKTSKGDWRSTTKAYYNWNIMCIYFEEQYFVPPAGVVVNPMTNKIYKTGDEDREKDREIITIFDQVSYTNTRLKNRIDFLDEDEFKKRTADPWELIDLVELREFIWDRT